MLKTLSFTKTNNIWEATATGIKGMWQLHVELPKKERGVRVVVYSKADASEAYSKVWDDANIDLDETSVTQPFISIVSESVKVVSYVQPTLGNIRTED